MSDLLNQLLTQAAASDKQRQEVSAIQLEADEQKRMSVASKTELKKQQVQANSINPTTDSVAYNAAVSLLSGYGKDSRTAQEQAVLNNPYDNSNLGFEEANRLFNARNRNVSAAIADTSAQRSGLSAIGDTTLDVARGAANMVAGPVALGAGLVNDNAGAALSQFIANANAGVDSLQSDSLNSRRKFNQTANQLDTRDNQLQYQRDLAAGESDLSATLKREGRNALNAIVIGGSDAQTLLSSTAQGVGSVLPVGTAANLISKATQGFGKVGGVLAESSVPLAVGAMEGGGAYQGTVAKVMGTSFDELSKTSPDFVSLVQSGMSPEDARVKLANSAGKTSAAIAGPAGIILGKLMPEFETLKLSKMPNASTAIAGIPKEGFEEGLQSWSGNLGQNTGIQQNVNPNQSLTEGAGKEVAEGVLSGMTTAGALVSPKLAVQGTVAAGKGALSVAAKGLDAVIAVADKKLAKNEASNPLNIANIAATSAPAAEASTAVVNSLTETKATVDPELAQRIDSVIAAVNSVSVFDPTAYEAASEKVKEAMSSSKNKVEELLNLRKIVEDESFDLADRRDAGMALLDNIAAFENFVNNNKDAIDGIPESDTVKQVIGGLQTVSQNVLQSPDFIKTVKSVVDTVVESQAKSSPVTALADPTTEEGKRAIAETVAVAKYAPEKSQKEAISVVLAHEKAGTISLSPLEKSALTAAQIILETFSKNNPGGEVLSVIDDVTGEAVENDGKGTHGYSATQYLKSITDSMALSEPNVAKKLMKDLRDFTQNYQNKVAALNEASNNTGKDIPYDKRMPTGNWVANGGKVFLNFSKDSRDLATRVLREAEAVTTMYNALAKEFPELGMKELPLTQADSLYINQEDGETIATAEQLRVNMNTRKDGKALTRKEKVVSSETVALSVDETTEPKAPISTDSQTSITDKDERIAILTKEIESIKADLENLLSIQKDIKKAMAAARKQNPGTLYGALRGKLSPDNVKKLFGKSRNFYASKTASTANLESAIRQIIEESPETLSDFFVLEGQDHDSYDSLIEDIITSLRSDSIVDRLPLSIKGMMGDSSTLSNLENEISNLTGKQLYNEYLRLLEIEAGQPTRSSEKAAPVATRSESVPARSEPRKENSRPASEAGRTTSTERKPEPVTTVKAVEPINTEFSSDPVVLDATREAIRSIREKISEWKKTLEAKRKAVSTQDKKDAGKLQGQAVVAAAKLLSESILIFGSAKEEIAYLSSIPSDVMTAADPKVFKRLWELKKREGVLFKPFSIFGNLISTATNIFMLGTKIIQGDKSSDRINAAFEKMYLNDDGDRTALGALYDLLLEKFGTSLSSKKEGQITTITAYMEDRIKELIKNTNSAIETNLYKNGKPSEDLVMLIQANPGDMLRQSKKLSHRFVRNRIYNLLDAKGDTDNVMLNQSMLEMAALAFVQWELSLADKKGVLDEVAIMHWLGVDFNKATELLPYLQVSASLDEATEGLSRLFMKYWGVKPDASQPNGFNEGVAKALALEMILANSAQVNEGEDTSSLGRMYRTKLVTETTTDSDTGITKPTKTVVIVSFNKLSKEVDDANKAFSNLIEETLFEEPDVPMYVGTGKVVPVSKTVLRSPNQPLSSEQQAFQDNEQKTPFYLVKLATAMYQAIGVDNLYRIRHLPTEDEEKLLNPNHRSSVVGKKKGISAAMDQMLNVLGKIETEAELSNTELESVPVYYKYEFISTGRLQMMGPHNAQANKQMRHVVMSTQSTLDLTDPKTKSGFYLALAQGLGIKVHTKGRIKSEAELNTFFEKEGIKKVLSGLTEWMKNPDKEMPESVIAGLTESFGGDSFTDAGLFSLLEYARYQAASESERKAFKTYAYVEADGVSNGPAGATFMMGHLKGITEKWLTNMARTGYFIGMSDGSNSKTLNEAREKDSVDLYGVIGKTVSKFISSVFDKAEGDKYTQELMTDVLEVYSELVDGIAVTSGSNGLITNVARSISKNPTTTAGYGSGATSTAVNLTKLMLDSFYEKLSKASLLRVDERYADLSIAQKYAQAFFGSYDPATIERVKTLFSKIENITSNQLGQEYIDGRLMTVSYHMPTVAFNKTGNGIPRIDESFTKSAITAITNNIEIALSRPLYKAIEEETGTMLEGSRHIVAATQVSGQFIELHFMKLYNAMVAKKVAASADYQKDDGVSIEDMREIEKEMLKLFPFIKTQTQTFDPSKSARLSADNIIAKSLNQSNVIRPNITVPTNPGVSGIPYLIIGLGDGRMMQFLGAPNGPERTLKIYDGMHMPIDQLDQQSMQANKAAWEAWHANPFATIQPTLKQFVENYDWNQFLIDASIKGSKEELILHNIKNKAKLILKMKRSSEIDGDYALDIYLNSIVLHNMAYAARTEATHTVLDKYKTYIDQMASVGASYLHNETGRTIDATDMEGSLILMNQEIDGLTASITSRLVASRAYSFTYAGRSPSKMEGASDIYTLREFFSKSNRSGTLGSLISALSTVVGDVKVVVITEGTTNGNFDLGTRQAAYDSASKTIYVSTNTKYTVDELVLHEAVHAATFEAIHDYYADSTSKSSAKVADTITNLEKLMERFFEEVTANGNAEMKSIMASMQATVSTDTEAIAKARLLNEFMAWALTDSKLKKELTKGVFGKIFLAAKKFTFKMLGLLGLHVPQNFYDEIAFNTMNVIVKGNSDNASNVVLSHAQDDERIKSIGLHFMNVVENHIDKHMLAASLPKQPAFTSIPKELRQAQLLAANSMSLLGSNFPDMTPLQLNVAASVVMAMATSSKIDANKLLGIEQIYTEFTKGLKFEDFLTVPFDQASQSDLAEAQNMYNTVMGNFITDKDTEGRSQLLPMFTALAIASDRMRAVLDKKAVKKGTSFSKESANDVLDSMGNIAMEMLDDSLSGAKRTGNMRDNIDRIIYSLFKNNNDTINFVTTASSKTNSVIDGLEERLVDALGYVSKKLEEKANATSGNTKLAKATSTFLSLTAKTLTDEGAEALGKSMLSSINKTDKFKPLRELIADFVGRTSNNALIYDMVKYVRSSIQQHRQKYRENLPSIIAEQFKRKLTKQEWTGLFNGLAKTDFAYLAESLGTNVALSLLNNPTELDKRIRVLESDMRSSMPQNRWNAVQKKSEQLAVFMNTGKTGNRLLRNAAIIQNQHGGTVEQIDTLVSLYALRDTDTATKNVLSSLVQVEKEGMSYVSDYLVGLRQDEQSNDVATSFNMYKGYIPSLQGEAVHLIVADDTRKAELIGKSYVRLGDYHGSSADVAGSKGYYYLKAPHRAAFSQGIMQNINMTRGGVDARTNLSINNTAGFISNPKLVNYITKNLGLETADTENLMPVFDATGTVVAYERSMHPLMLAKMEKDTHLAKMMGVWRGRQIEEGMAAQYNVVLVGNLNTMYNNDISADPANEKDYVNLYKSTDPIHKDALKLLTYDARMEIERVFGKDRFMVRRDMINNAIGYRTPFVGDVWTGTSNWSPETLETARKVAISIFGNKAYEYFVNAEQVWKNFVQDAKVVIVVKSIVVPVGNIIANIAHLMMRGISPVDIVKGIAKKTAETNFYTKQSIRLIKLEADLLSVKTDVIASRKIRNEMDSIEDSFRRLTIWPLIKAGEFSAISDLGIARDDILITEGRLQAYFEKLVDKLPEGAKTVGKYGLITKDTALFQGLQKTVEYGDFLAKSILFDNLIAKGNKPEAALATITEEFVNYDLLPGRFREYGENIGAWWFTAFKIRSTKIAASVLRNNPLRALMISLAPLPNMAGTVINDNAIAKVMAGELGYSLGLGNVFSAYSMNPIYSLMR